MEEETETLSNFRKPLTKSLPFLYIIAIMTALAHLTVGIIWEGIPINKTESTKMTYPYIGGYITLVSIAFLIIVIYFLLMLGHQPEIPKNLRRFSLTLSVLLLLVQCVIVILFSFRANDIRISKEQLTSPQYGLIFSSTLIDILFTILSLPLYLYFVFINMKTVHLTPEESSDIHNQDREGETNMREEQHESPRQDNTNRIQSSQNLQQNPPFLVQMPPTIQQQLQLAIKSQQRQDKSYIYRERVVNPLVIP